MLGVSMARMEDCEDGRMKRSRGGRSEAGRKLASGRRRKDPEQVSRLIDVLLRSLVPHIPAFPVCALHLPSEDHIVHRSLEENQRYCHSYPLRIPEATALLTS